MATIGAIKKNIIRQNDERLLQKIKTYGCKFRCLQAIAEFHLKELLTAEDIVDEYREIVKLGDSSIMNENCRCGVDEHKIIIRAFEKLGNRVFYFRNVGYINEQGQAKDWSGNYISYPFCIAHQKTNTEDGHFTLINNKNELLFDPWNHEIGGIMPFKGYKKKMVYNIKIRDEAINKACKYKGD